MDKRILIGIVGSLWHLTPVIAFAASQAATLKTTSPGKITPASQPSTIIQNPSPSPVLPKQVPSYQLYKYFGDRYRDPFIPLTAVLNSDQAPDRPPQIGSLTLKGIMQDSKGRLALLTSGVSSYILRGGRLYDGRNHMMKGISGIIKSNSVILIGSDRTVRELKVKAAL